MPTQVTQRRGVELSGDFGGQLNATLNSPGLNAPTAVSAKVSPLNKNLSKANILAQKSNTYKQLLQDSLEREQVELEKQTREGASMGYDPEKGFDDAKTKAQQDAFLKVRGKTWAAKKATDLQEQARNGEITADEAIAQLNAGIGNSDVSDSTFIEGATPILGQAITALKGAEISYAREQVAEQKAVGLQEAVSLATKQLASGADPSVVYDTVRSTLTAYDMKASEINSAISTQAINYFNTETDLTKKKAYLSALTVPAKNTGKSLVDNVPGLRTVARSMSVKIEELEVQENKQAITARNQFAYNVAKAYETETLSSGLALDEVKLNAELDNLTWESVKVNNPTETDEQITARFTGMRQVLESHKQRLDTVVAEAQDKYFQSILRIPSERRPSNIEVETALAQGRLSTTQATSLINGNLEKYDKTVSSMTSKIVGGYDTRTGEWVSTSSDVSKGVADFFKSTYSLGRAFSTVEKISMGEELQGRIFTALRDIPSRMNEVPDELNQDLRDNVEVTISDTVNKYIKEKEYAMSQMMSATLPTTDETDLIPEGNFRSIYTDRIRSMATGLAETNNWDINKVTNKIVNAFGNTHPDIVKDVTTQTMYDLQSKALSRSLKEDEKARNVDNSILNSKGMPEKRSVINFYSGVKPKGTDTIVSLKFGVIPTLQTTRVLETGVVQSSPSTAKDSVGYILNNMHLDRDAEQAIELSVKYGRMFGVNIKDDPEYYTKDLESQMFAQKIKDKAYIWDKGLGYYIPNVEHPQWERDLDILRKYQYDPTIGRGDAEGRRLYEEAGRQQAERERAQVEAKTKLALEAGETSFELDTYFNE